LEEEGSSIGHVGQLRGQAPGLTGENQRREGGQLGLGLLEGLGIGPLRLLRGGQLAP